MKNESAPARWELIAVAAAMLIAASLSFYCLGCQSFWYDEAHTWQITLYPWQQVVPHIYHVPAMPLYFLIFRAWSMFGSGEAFYRALSIFPAVATIPVLFLIGRRVFGPIEGVLAAVLFSLNAFVIHYAQEARGYSLVMFLISLSMLLFIEGVEEPTRRRWISYLIVTAMALATHILAYAVVMTQLLTLLFRKKNTSLIRALSVPFGVLVLLVMPLGLVPALNFVRDGAIGWIPKPGFSSLLGLPSQLAGQPAFKYSVIVAGIPIFLMVRSLIKKGRTPESWRYSVIVFWFLLPVTGTFLISLALPMFLSRYLAVAAPALVLLVAVGLSHIRPRLLAGVVSVAYLVFALLGLEAYYRDPKSDWRGTVAYIEKRAQPDDGLIIYADYLPPVYEFYEKASPSAIDLEAEDVDPEKELLTTPRERVWLVIHDVSTEERQQELRSLQHSIDQVFDEVERKTLGGIKVRLFQKRTPEGPRRSRADGI